MEITHGIMNLKLSPNACIAFVLIIGYYGDFFLIGRYVYSLVLSGPGYPNSPDWG